MKDDCKCGSAYVCWTQNFGTDINWCQDCYKWFFDDGTESTKGELGAIADGLICPTCKMTPTKEGHDPCIANLPNVRYACCGHGNSKSAYVSFNDGRVIRNTEALEYFKSLK